jgi:hypothetical protein
MTRWSPVAPPRPGCPHRRLRKLLEQALPVGLALGESNFRPWASANFVGARHIFAATLAAGDGGATAAALQSALNAAEWPLAGHIVADALVETESDGIMIRIEILTVED